MNNYNNFIGFIFSIIFYGIVLALCFYLFYLPELAKDLIEKGKRARLERRYRD